MGARESPAQRARRLSTQDVKRLVADLRETRIQLGLSQDAVARAAGLSRHALGRMELAKGGPVDVVTLAAVAAVLGLDLRATTWPAADPLRGAVQPRLLAAFRARLPASTGWGSEVPLPIEGDRRAWDATLIVPGGWTGIEGVSRVGAADALVRRVEQKQRDDPRIGSAVLVVLDNARNRRELRASLDVVRAAFPLRTSDVMRDCAEGRPPRLNGIVLQRLAGPQVVHSGAEVVDGRPAPTPKFVDKPVGAAQAVP